MDYYACPIDELYDEVQRRGYIPSGDRDHLSEGLRRDDAARGSEASTVTTECLKPSIPHEQSLPRTAEFGQTVPACLLANESAYEWQRMERGQQG